MQLHTITELLAISNYHVSHMIVHNTNRLDLVLEQTTFAPAICSGCCHVHNTPVHSIGMSVVEDLPISGKRVFLHVPKRKSVCVEDGIIRVETLDWLRGRFTKRFTDQVYRLTFIATNQEAGWYLGIDDEVVYRIDRHYLEELSKKNLSPIPALRYMSVDEVAWQKWHHYVTNVVDIEKRKVIWNHDNRGKTVLDVFYKSLGQENCSNPLCQ